VVCDNTWLSAEKVIKMRFGITGLMFGFFLCCNPIALGQDDDPDKKEARPDPNEGFTLSQRWCASCHIVSRDQSKGTDATPSFEMIARSPEFSVEKLAFFLLAPHPVMPNMSLSRAAARDIAAYIAQLRK
jgi:mono/diheme cytochrome c family protein